MKQRRVSRTMMALSAFALASIAAAPLALADEPKAEVKATEEARPTTSVTDRWGTRGGATLGEGMALRVQVGGSTAQTIASGSLNVEATLLFALGRSFDLGVNLRGALLGQFGVSPGLAVRFNLVDDKIFHLSLVGNLQVPVIISPGVSVGLGVEPGLMVSYFFNERVELFSGLLFAYTPIFLNGQLPGSGHASFIGTFRLGMAYTLSTSNMGFYVNADASAGYEPWRRFIMVGDRATGFAVNLALVVGTQFKF